MVNVLPVILELVKNFSLQNVNHGNMIKRGRYVSMKLFLVVASDNIHSKVAELLQEIEELADWHIPVTEQAHPAWFVALQKNRTAAWLAEKLRMKAQPSDPTFQPNTGMIIEIADYYGYHDLHIWQQIDTWWEL